MWRCVAGDVLLRLHRRSARLFHVCIAAALETHCIAGHDQCGGKSCIRVGRARTMLSSCCAQPFVAAVCACRAACLGFSLPAPNSLLQDSGGGPDVAVAIHPNYQDRVVLLQQDNRVAIETFEEVRPGEIRVGFRNAAGGQSRRDRDV